VPDTSGVRSILQEVGRTLRSAELSGIVPVNPEQPGTVRPEQLQAAAKAAGQ
jgi:hypothetical protein